MPGIVGMELTLEERLFRNSFLREKILKQVVIHGDDKEDTKNVRLVAKDWKESCTKLHIECRKPLFYLDGSEDGILREFMQTMQNLQGATPPISLFMSRELFTTNDDATMDEFLAKFVNSLERLVYSCEFQTSGIKYYFLEAGLESRAAKIPIGGRNQYANFYNLFNRLVRPITDYEVNLPAMLR